MSVAAVSIRDVAELAGVSVGTVSNVLNRPDLVSPATRDRVQSAISDLGFVRNESARQLRAGRSRTVGLVVLDVANPFFTDVARGVEDTASEAGLAVILCNSDEKSSKEDAYLDLLEEQRVKGILITPADGISERLGDLRRRGTPVVLLDQRSTRKDQCSVSVDDALGGDLAVTHLLDYGHRRLAFVGGPMSIAQVQDRLRGARAAMERAEGDVAELVVQTTTGLNVAAGRAAAAELIKIPRARRPTAVFCANDLLALGALQELTRQSVRVPQDMAIVGYDDIDFASAAAIPLSSVRQPRHQLGRMAAELLIEETAEGGRHRHQQVVFEPELVVRESSSVRRRTGRRA
jgi:LacI family transcriptional regulator